MNAQKKAVKWRTPYGTETTVLVVGDTTAAVEPALGGMVTAIAPKDDSVNHPHHYTQGGVECIDALDAAVTGCPPDEAICVANVIKYVWRYTDKAPVESLKKARWYLDRLIGKVERRTQQ